MTEFFLAWWLVWCFFCCMVVVLSATVARHRHPCFDGFNVRIPSWVAHLLTLRELDAVVEHELGHKRRRHVWINLALACVFAFPTERRRMRQELEADDCVRDAEAMASALMKMSQHPFDVERALRLTERAKKGRQEAGNPAPGTGEPTL